MKRLDLGGGLVPVPGAINIDLIYESDIKSDLNFGLPMFEIANWETKYKREDDKALPANGYSSGMILPDVDGITAYQLIEHLSTIIPLMNDCYYVLKPSALFEISTPYAGTKQWYQDPTHVRAYVEESFNYFSDNGVNKKEQDEYGIIARFKIIKCVREDWQLIVTLQK